MQKLTVLFFAFLFLHAQQPVTPNQPIDFSGASWVKPWPIGPSLPGTCIDGTAYYVTGSAASICVNGSWVGFGSGSQGPAGPAGPQGATGPQGSPGFGAIPQGSISGNTLSLYPFTFGINGLVYTMAANTPYSWAAQVTLTNSISTSNATIALSTQAGGGYEIWLPSGLAPTISTVGNITVYGSGTSDPNAVILYTCQFTNGGSSATWASCNPPPQIAFPTTYSIGSGIQLALGNTLQVDPSSIGQRVAVPANSSVACTVNQWSTDGTYYYLCVSSSAPYWKRISLVSF